VAASSGLTPADDGPLELADESALRALRSGDEKAITEVVRAWTPGMLRLARAQVASQQTAEDVVQDAWVTVLTGLHRFQGRSALHTWVLGVVVNTARRAGGRERRVLPFSAAWRADREEAATPAVDPDHFHPTTGAWISPPNRWDLPQDALAAAELRTVVHSAIDTLPARQRITLTAHDTLGLSADDTRTLFGLTVGNQRVLLHRARARLRTAVDNYLATAKPVEHAAPAHPVTTPNRSLPRLPRPGQAIACRQLVELVDDYLVGDLHNDLRHPVAAHLSGCDACAGYVTQVKQLLELTAHVSHTAPPHLLSRLAAAISTSHAHQQSRVRFTR
jgi:RNA polymerase sigma-70 factor, ECF subfamily